MNVKLRKVRESKKISQAEIAEILGISQTQYHRNETGKGFFTNNQWEILSDYLDVPISNIRDNNDSVLIFKKNDQRNSYFSYNMYLSDKIISILEEKIQNLEIEVSRLKKQS